MKPVVGVVVPYGFDRSIFPPLSSRYRFVFFRVRLTVPAKERVEQIVGWLESRGVVVEGVLGVSDSASVLASLVANRLGLPGCSIEAMLRGQHKGVFLTLAGKVHAGQRSFVQVEVGGACPYPWPVFIRPVRGYYSKLSALIASEDEWRAFWERVESSRAKHRAQDGWYRHVYRRWGGDLPSLDAFVVEPAVSRVKLYTLEGWVDALGVGVVGVTESVMYDNGVSFRRFDFPADLTPAIINRVKALVQELVVCLGLAMTGFNVEFFVSADEQITLIEINTRMAQQFMPLYVRAVGKNYLEALVQLSMGEAIDYRLAGDRRVSCVIARYWQDGLVRRYLTDGEFSELRALGVYEVRYMVPVGERLSRVVQDVYSFRFASVYVEVTSDEQLARAEDTIREVLGRCIGSPPATLRLQGG